ncbi:hypothetical protein H9P43_007528 [Blastocladiella emersonii ATCC 22665]|nr:hypothetical protein H9P43_007528 [Blastocladiella emersonii ATCC 22665]
MSTSDRVMEKVVVAKAFFVKDLETAMVKATKRNSKAPKWKHVSILLNATWRRDISIADIGQLLELRLRDSSWSVVFKALIVTHILMDQGSGDRLIGYLATQPSILNLANFRDSSGVRIEQSKNISRYAAYLEEKVHVYREQKRDYCRPASPTKQSADSYGSINRDAHLPTDVARAMRTAPVNDALIKELAAVLRQFQVLLRAHFAASEIDNEVTLAAFKLLLRDLMRLYHILNEGVINILQRLGDLPPPLARNGIALFRQLVAQAKAVDTFLATARGFPPGVLQISVPDFRHIPDIADSLEAELDKGNLGTIPRNNNGNGNGNGAASPPPQQRQYSSPSPAAPSSSSTSPTARKLSIAIAPTPTGPPPAPMAAPPPALIDFFSALEDNTKQVAAAYPAPAAGAAPFDPFSSAGFGFNGVASSATGASSSAFGGSSANGGNPFASSSSPGNYASPTHTASSGPGSPWQNPFASAAPGPLFDPFASGSPVPPMPTGSVGSAMTGNPFGMQQPQATGSQFGGSQSSSFNPFANPSPNPMGTLTGAQRSASPAPAAAVSMALTGGSNGFANGSTAANPFGAQSTGFGNGAGSLGMTSSPSFGMGMSSMQQSQQQPFGMQSTGFMGGVQQQSTGFMGGMQQPQSTGFMGMQQQPAAAANPFGMTASASFGMGLSGMSQPQQQSQQQPFGMQSTGFMGMHQQQPQATGFGGATSNPFGGNGATSAATGAAGPNYVAVSDPFANLDPFGKPAATAASSNPFGAQAAGQKPATTTTTAQPFMF